MDGRRRCVPVRTQMQRRQIEFLWVGTEYSIGKASRRSSSGEDDPACGTLNVPTVCPVATLRKNLVPPCGRQVIPGEEIGREIEQ